MISINKILLLFILFVSFAFVGMWEFVQSEFFAGILSKNVTKYTKEFLGADLKFEKVSFKLFPPGVEVNNVELVNNKDKDLSYRTQVSGLGILFNPMDLFETELKIDKLYLNDGILKVNFHSDKNNTIKKKEKITDIDFKISKVLKEIRAKLPFLINNVELNKINVSYNENSIITHQAMLTLFKNHISLKIMLRNLNLNKMNIFEEILDEVYVSTNIYDNALELNELYLTKNMNKVTVKGKVNNFTLLSGADWALTGTVNGNIQDIHKYLAFDNIGKLNRGIAEIDFQSKGSLSNYFVDADVKLEDVQTDFANADKIKMNLKMDNKNIVFKSFELNHDGGRLKLQKPFEFYNFTTNKFVEENIYVNTKKFKMTNALRYLRNSLGILKGKLSGDVEFKLGTKDFQFKIGESFKVDELKLIVNEDGKSLLNPKQIKIKSGLFDIRGSDVYINLDLKLDNTEIQTVGFAKNGNVGFKIKNSKIDISDIGKIAGFKIRGNGNLDLDVSVDKNKEEIAIKTQLKEFSFEGYKQDNIKANLVIDLKNKQLNIKNVSAQTGQSMTTGYFKLNFSDLSVDSKVQQEKFLLSDIKKMYSPALKTFDLPTNKIYGEWKTEVKLSGKLNLDDLVLNGKFIGQNNFIYGESFDMIQLKYTLNQSAFGIEDLYAKKANGIVQAGAKYNLKTDNIIFWGNINKIPLMEINNFSNIPTNLTGNLSGIIKGEIQNKKIKLDTEINISKSKIHNKSIGDSYVNLTLRDDLLKYDTSLLGKIFVSSGKIFLKNKSKESMFKWRINLPDINNTLGVLTFVDHFKTGFSGAAYLGGEGKYKLNELNKFSTKIKIDKLYIDKGKVHLDYLNKGAEQIVVDHGKIKKWDLNIRGSKMYLISKGKGDIAHSYDVKTRLKSDATMLEIFNDLISKSSGTLLGSIHNYKNFYDEDYVAKIVSNNLTMNSDFMPLALSRGDLLINYKKRKFELKKLKAQLNSGTLSVKGNVDLSRVIPDINIRYEFKNAGIPLLKKSSIIFSGKGSFIGKSLPYTLGGVFQIQKCNIVNEITDFAGGENIIKTDIDYLPEDNSRVLNQFVNLNININTLEPIRITNSMADLGFTGNVHVSGGEREPRLAGKISLAPIKNQIFFKNNTFDLTKGNIFFYDRNKLFNPELDFQAKSVINKYNVNISLLGPLKEFKLDLNSDPVLAESDILSLIAFGYTQDLSAKLSDSEKESMTRAGVGSIIFDSFKINETLKNEFGLQVNLGTQVSQNVGSYLSQKNAERGNVGKVHSATTIEIKKQISDAVGLSVSSTVGGTIGQKQRMNLNYNLNSNLSVEGVYQSNTQTQTETLINNTSLGADVKIRWSFR